MKEKEIITEPSTVPKYFIEPSKLNSYGIEFNKTADATLSPKLHELYQEFCIWKNEKKNEKTAVHRVNQAGL